MKIIGKILFETEQGTTTDAEKDESAKKATRRRIKLRKGIDPEVYAGEEGKKQTRDTK